MSKLSNKIVNIIKIFFLIIILIGTLYIKMCWYDSQNLSPFANFFDFFELVIPYTILLIMFTIDIVLDYKMINYNYSFHVGSYFSLITILYIIYRTIGDNNMVLLSKENIGVNYYFFEGMILPIKIITYLMIIINCLLIYENKIKKVQK